MSLLGLARLWKSVHLQTRKSSSIWEGRGMCVLCPSEKPAELQPYRERSRAGIRILEGDCGFLSPPLLPSRGVFTSSFCHLHAPSSLRTPCRPCEAQSLARLPVIAPHPWLLVQGAEGNPQTQAVPASFWVPCPWMCTVPLDRETWPRGTGW